MSSALKNLSNTGSFEVSQAAGMRFAIIVSEWNDAITSALLTGAFDTLIKYGVPEENIFIHHVPGSYELTTGARFIAEYCKDIDAVICLGCVIQGETKHFDFICHAVSQGLTNLSIQFNKPFIFGVLTPNTMQQATDRAGGKHGNKGDEAAVTAIKMVVLQKKLITMRSTGA